MSILKSTELRLTERESIWHDVIRCALIVQVVLGHLSAIALPTIPELLADLESNIPAIAYRLCTRFGAQAAYLFVFLSGFMVGGSLIAGVRNGSYPPPIDFFQRRMHRIAPIAIISILITAAFDSAGIFLLGREDIYRAGYSYDMVSTLNAFTFLGNILFLQPTFFPSFGSNGPLWTLGYIVQFYVVGYFLLLLATTRIWLAISIFVPVMVAATVHRPEWAILFICWISGGLCRHINFPQTAATPSLAVAGALFITSNLMPPLISAAMSVPVGALLIIWAHATQLSPAPKLYEPIRRMSNESYTVYAIHHPAIMLLYASLFTGSTSHFGWFLLYTATSLVLVAALCVIISRFTSLISPHRR